MPNIVDTYRSASRTRRASARKTSKPGKHSVNRDPVAPDTRAGSPLRPVARLRPATAGMR